MDFTTRYLWPLYWAELLFFIVMAAIVMSKGAVGGIITFFPVIGLLIAGAVVALSGSNTIRGMLATGLGMGAFLIVGGLATFLSEQIRK